VGVRHVIIGAGSAGAVIAARLTERSDREVVLVEAGPDYHPDGAIPADLSNGTKNSTIAHDWGFRHQPTALDVVHRYPRGRVVGGSSAVNTCIALRPRPYDLDEWASLGLPAWSWDKCLPAFKRLERDMDFDDEWHGRDGPVPIRRHPADELVPWQAAFIEACRELGFAACPDHNHPRSSGVGPHAMNKVGGVRMSAARCYLTAAVRRRDNLTIRAGALVRRVLFDGRRATGVEIVVDGRVEQIAADRVVVSAGAIASPALLMRSGVGPRAAVERLGVDLVSDVPAVGARLLDHPGCAILLAPRWGLIHRGDPLIQTLLRFTSAGSPFPDDVMLQPGSLLTLPSMDVPVFGLMCCLGKPRGAGRIEVRSTDPEERPRIVSDFLSDPMDLARAIESVELCRIIAKTKVMKDLAFFLWPHARRLESRATIRDWILSGTGSGYHPAGTVPMGPDGSPDAAADERGRVRGTDNLIVADASIMPTLVSANTNLTALMIGERFGEWLREA
jgi:choline dehydrogenase